jgi:hypothetical protein
MPRRSRVRRIPIAISRCLGHSGTLLVPPEMPLQTRHGRGLPATPAAKSMPVHNCPAISRCLSQSGTFLVPPEMPLHTRHGRGLPKTPAAKSMPVHNCRKHGTVEACPQRQQRSRCLSTIAPPSQGALARAEHSSYRPRCRCTHGTVEACPRRQQRSRCLSTTAVHNCPAAKSMPVHDCRPRLPHDCRPRLPTTAAKVDACPRLPHDCPTTAPPKSMPVHDCPATAHDCPRLPATAIPRLPHDCHPATAPRLPA